MSKVCAKCGIDKEASTDNFYRRASSPDGLRSACIQCVKAHVLVRYHSTIGIKEKRRAHYNPDEKRKQDLDRAYNMTPENFDALHARQGGVCALCGAAKGDARGHRLSVDHDHDTLGVRGLLCGACNFLVGHAEAFAKRAGIDMQVAGQLIDEYLNAPQYFSNVA